MISVLGIVIVLGAIAGGYLMEHGRIAVLLQPAEIVIIFGAAIGTVVTANPLPTLMRIAGGVAGVFARSRYDRGYYLEALKMMYELFSLSRKGGMAKLEEEVDHPENGRADQDDEKRRENEYDHRNRHQGGQPRCLLFRTHHSLFAKLR